MSPAGQGSNVFVSSWQLSTETSFDVHVEDFGLGLLNLKQINKRSCAFVNTRANCMEVSGCQSSLCLTGRLRDAGYRGHPLCNRISRPPGRFSEVNRAARSRWAPEGGAGKGRLLTAGGRGGRALPRGWQRHRPAKEVPSDPWSWELCALRRKAVRSHFFFFFPRERRGVQVLLPTGAGWRQVALLKSSGGGGG